MDSSESCSNNDNRDIESLKDDSHSFSKTGGVKSLDELKAQSANDVISNISRQCRTQNSDIVISEQQILESSKGETNESVENTGGENGNECEEKHGSKDFLCNENEEKQQTEHDEGTEMHVNNNITDCRETMRDLDSTASSSSNDVINLASVENKSDIISKQKSMKDELHSNPTQSSSLALLAQYDTEEESDDDVREIPPINTNRYVEIDSDSSTSDVEFLSENRPSIDLDDINVGHDVEEDDDDEEGNNRIKRQPKVKGELDLEDLPRIEDLHITVPEEECTELGKIISIVDQLVLVNALSGTVPLDLGTVLFRDKGKLVLGEVFDVLGQVSDPLYCVRFNSNKEIKEKGIELGETIYVAPRTEHTQFIVLANLMKMRGSDASWENDVEPPPRFIDYSDDEEERAARRPNRKRQSSGGSNSTGRGSYNSRRPFRGNYIGRGGALRPQYQNQGNYNIIGNSWHSNYNQRPLINQSQYRLPGHLHSTYIRPSLNTPPYQQTTPMNSDLVLNPYAVYPPPTMQPSLFPPMHYQQRRPN